MEMKNGYWWGTGRRKTATARVFLRPGSGTITVNRRTLDDFFPNDVLKMIVRQPLLLTETKVDLSIWKNLALLKSSTQKKWLLKQKSKKEAIKSN